VAEYVTWGKTTLIADGLGSYIKKATDAGDFHGMALGTGVDVRFRIIVEPFFWRKLYLLAEDRSR